jgi:hypothetical protein
MKPEFYWTAKRYEGGVRMQTAYFSTEEERSRYLRQHPGWQKRGKICAENLKQHLRQEKDSFCPGRRQGAEE